MICDNCERQNGCRTIPHTIDGKELCGLFAGIKDSGNRTEFAAGQKHDTGKPPITLLDRDFLEGTAQVMRFGAEKYGRHNWCNGISHTRLADAAMRHLIAWASGEDIDPESGLPHIDHASASLNMLRGNQRLHPGLDDRYRGPDMQDIPGRRTDG